MTNKLPVVGKRYRLKKGSDTFYKDGTIFEVKEVDETQVLFAGEILNRASTRYFFLNFEELPDSNPQKPEEVQVKETPNPVDLEKKEVNEVERALERFKLAINSAEARAMTGETGIVEKVLGRAQNLVNALEAERNERAVMSKPKFGIVENNEIIPVYNEAQNG